MENPAELIGRIRINEARLSNLRERLLVTDNNMIDEFKRISLEIRGLKEETKELKTDIFKIKEIVNDITREIGSFARTQEIKVLERYINMWNPLNFTTEKEVIKLIEDAGLTIKDRPAEKSRDIG